MIDTFKPLYVTKEALGYEDRAYPYSWTHGKAEGQWRGEQTD
jgi:hypothetical protein